MYKELRMRSPESVIKEIDHLVKDLKVDFIWDVSENFLENRIWFENFYNLYRKYRRKPVFCIYSRADRITEDIAEKLQELNIQQVLLGIESQDSNSLKMMNKGITIDINKNAVQYLNSHRITVITSFIFGVPEESRDSLNNSLRFIQELTKTRKNITKVVA